MLELVAKTITRYSMFQPDQRVGVAVSGGADSVCLMHVLRELAPRWNLRLTVLHLDHQLRGEESRQDAAFVRDLASALDLPCEFEETDVAALCRQTGENLEQAARAARLQFFQRLIAAGTLDRIATGHTRSDQAETVLFRFLRGSGTAGLAGIRPVTHEGIVRPLLEINRATVEHYLRERGIAWRTDSTNASSAFARNRIRHELLPQLTRDWNPAMAETLAHTADWAQAEEAYWESELARIEPTHLVFDPPTVLLQVDSLADLPLAVARRLVRRAVGWAKGDLRGISFEHLAGVLELAASAEGHGRLQIPGLDIFRSFNWLRIAPPALDNLDNRNYRLLLPVPGAVRLPGRKTVVVRAELSANVTDTAEGVYNGCVGFLDWNRLSGSLEVRNWRPGDQYQPVGHSGAEKIKSLFQEARVPLWERRHWPIVIMGEEILWARRFGPAAGYAADSGSSPILGIRETES
ncbi:MAG TPA: tRNA lysidine(34) synthetase TilS [Bryobacteraceae bacterium]|jgi:tRNA(Ile)-lysidine synthase|nr:tRNA lysidine(34) synthetase TilS [Bryobacteraceae bacterium]